MNKPIKFTDVPRDEMKDILISRISGDEHEQEMYLLISTFTAYNLKNDLYLKYFDELATDEIINELSSSFQGWSWEKEDIAWECAYETLGEKLLDITDYFDEYMDTYLLMTQPSKACSIQCLPFIQKFKGELIINIEELKIEIQKVLVEEGILYVELDGVRIFENLNKIKMEVV